MTIQDYSPYVRIDYTEELTQLPETYRAAMAADVTAFAAWLKASADRPLLAIGAGGSLPIAQLACTLHQRATGQLARAGEPLDIFLADDEVSNTAGLLVTASGSHSDSLAACAALADAAPGWAVFCGKQESTGARLLAGSRTAVFDYDLLPELHGWIAVNALLGQAVVLARAYATAFPEQLGDLPAELTSLLPLGTGSVEDALTALIAELTAVFERDTLIFLHGPETRAAALDLDSKFAESGLGHLVVSEYRNFAHGRYQMMLPLQDSSAVLAFATPREALIADATLAVFPDHIPHACVDVPGDGAAAQQVASLTALLLVVGALGEVRGLRPGWGSRETFGDLLYELDLGELFRIGQGNPE
ncbi:MAG: hypothetical protein WA971_06320 [Microbacterium sp.]